MPIRVLPPEVASQIAAGEVIERPASVVKELLENALDAGAKTITIATEAAGRTLVEVSDDGCGIPSAELALAVSRHATSKLTLAEELFRITTLGFRGEALASVGSVSRLTLTSRAANETTAARLEVRAGEVGPVAAVGAPAGTQVRVADLFYNLPARMKFLKKDVTERRAIDALVERYALAYPHVRFKLAEGGNVSLQTAGDGDRRAVLAALYGVEVARQMLEVLAEDQSMRLTGCVSPTSLTRSNRKEITFFVNGRWVQDVPLTMALLRAYHTLLMVGRYPLAALFVQIPAGEVDVNVHPAKAEVRFGNPDQVFSFVQRAVRRALLAYAPVPHVASQMWGSRQAPAEPSEFVAARPAWSATAVSQHTIAGAEPEMPIASAAAGNGRQPTMASLPLLRLIGQIGATYLVAEGPDGLYLIDQHAAHERVLFERLMSGRHAQHAVSQELLAATVVHMGSAQSRLLEPQLETLRQFGFAVESFGADAFQVRAVPALFARSDPAAALRALVEDFEEDETPLQAEAEALVAARVCKRLAVRAGQVMSPEEQRALVTDLEACSAPRTCPHGRPTMVHLSVETLERQFGRRGAR
jgi:DNA mismatch repair protein MutL